MQQYFCRIEADDVQYYLLTELFDEGKNGFDLTISNGEQVWRESGRKVSRWSNKKICDQPFPDEFVL